MAAEKRPARVSRRNALRTGTSAGALGAGMALGVGLRQARASAGPRQFTVDGVVVDPPVNFVRAGSGPPQRGDWFYLELKLYQEGKTDGPQIGFYQCFGPWTAAAAETTAPNQRLVSVIYELFGVGALTGLIHEGGAAPNDLVGAVQGGTGAFAGALGTFQQRILSGTLPGVASGQTVIRASFDLI